MSGYWDAVLGAALGLPGTARPQQPPLFAAEDGAALAEVEEQRDAPRAPTPLAQPPALQQPPPAFGEARAAEPAPVLPQPPAPVPAAAEAGTTRAGVGLPQPPEPPPRPSVAEMPAAELTAARRGRDPEPIVEPVKHEAHRERDPGIETASDRGPKWKMIEAVPPPPPAVREAAAPAEVPPSEPILIAAEPSASPAPTIEPRYEEPTPQPLTIEIGRIDVRILAPEASPPAVVPKPAAPPEGVPSLADYLSRRSEAVR